MADTNPNASMLSNDEVARRIADLSGWEIQQHDDVARLVRRFTFDDFASALAFTNKVGEAAEAADHHPQITLTWGLAQVEWWSHSAGGITENDIEMARRTDALVSAP